MENDFKYRGFLSYSHRDIEFAERLHQQIETFKVPKDLVGKNGSRGPIPAKLRPIFRDRFDLSAGHSLDEKIREALTETANLIVMCSPGAAQSDAVNEEIRLYKSLGREKYIFPIIVDGSPNSDEQQCFPPMLRAVLDASGQPTGETIEPIAADARDHGDGKELAVQKIIAGLLGINLDELRQREKLLQKRKIRRTRIIAIIMALHAIAAIAGWKFAWSAKEEALAQKQIAIEERTEAEKQRKIAEQQTAVAQQRYEQALNETLRLVVTKASYETHINPSRTFQLQQVAVKGGDNSFQDFVQSDPRGSDYVFHQLTGVLLDFAKYPPGELRDFDLEKAWLDHAKVIITNLLRRDPENAQFLETRQRIDQALARF